MSDVEDISDRERHESGICLGIWGSCEWCDAEDALRAAEIKRATRALDVRRDGYESVAGQ